MRRDGIGARRARCATGGRGRATVAVDAAIVLAADVSRSIDDGEFALERRGYADAIQSQQLIDAVSTGPHGAIRFLTSNGPARARRRWSWTGR